KNRPASHKSSAISSTTYEEMRKSARREGLVPLVLPPEPRLTAVAPTLDDGGRIGSFPVPLRDSFKVDRSLASSSSNCFVTSLNSRLSASMYAIWYPPGFPS